MTIKNIYFRPVWTCGRYDESTKSAIMYNLIAGFSFFFEDDSAEVIGLLLSIERGCSFKLQDISSQTNISVDSINAFMEQLLDLGLLSSKETDERLVSEYRKKLSNLDNAIINGGDELGGMPIPISDAEKAYIHRVNKKAAVVMMELTYNCSEQCIHCYNPGATRNNSERNHRGDRRKLTIDQYRRIIDELDEEGTFLVCLTGGDPFSNPYAFDIIAYLYKKGIAFEIFTNGQSIYGKEAIVANYFPCYVAISIYSTDAKIHDSITRREGSYAKSVAVLERFHDLHIPIIIKCVIMQNNVRTYSGVAKLGEVLGAEVQFDCRLFDSSEGDKCVSTYLRLTPEQLRIAFRDKRSLYYVGSEARDYGAIKHVLDEPACLTGFNNLCITPEGYVIPCCCFHAILGDVTKQHIHEIVHENKLLDRLTSLNLSEYKECGRHEYCDFCILCPGLNFSENGNPKIASENNCYYAKVRYQLYKDLQAGKDPLKGRLIEVALKELPVHTEALRHVNSESHYNEELSVSDL